MIEPRYSKYYLLMEKIIGMIENEEIEEGNMIPSERELMESYSISRITVRRALDELVSKGYLYRVQGKGTYVRKKSITQGLFKLTSCTEDIKRLGMQCTVKILEKAIIDADKNIAKRLSLQEGEKVFKIKRLFLGDGNPINVTSSYIAYKYLVGIEKYDLSTESFYKIAEEKYGLKITKANRTIEAVLSHGNYSEQLSIEDGQPLLFFKGETYVQNNSQEFVLEYFKSAYRTNTFKFYIEQFK